MKLLLSIILLLTTLAASAQTDSLQTKMEVLLRRSSLAVTVYINRTDHFLEMTANSPGLKIPYLSVSTRFSDDSGSRSGQVFIICNEDKKCIQQDIGRNNIRNLPEIMLRFPIKDDAREFAALMGELKSGSK